MKSCFISNGQVKIHVLDNESAAQNLPPLLVAGGLWEPAERAMPILLGLSSHVVAFSFRGRGLSSTPETGYDLNDHLGDMEAVVKGTGLTEYCVLGFSRGATYALGWALGHQQDMRGLILVDQPPVHIRPGPGYVDFWSSLVYLNVPILNFMRREALEGLARDALDVDFSSRLRQLNIPVKLFAGRNKEAKIPSDLTDEIIELYKKEIPNCDVVEFLHSGHMIPDEEQQKYLLQIDSFIKEIGKKHSFHEHIGLEHEKQ